MNDYNFTEKEMDEFRTEQFNILREQEELTPADVGIAAAVAAAEALEDDGFPSWEKIADVHRKAAEARLLKIKEQDREIRILEKSVDQLRVMNAKSIDDLKAAELEVNYLRGQMDALRSNVADRDLRIAALVEEVEALEIECKNS